MTETKSPSAVAALGSSLSDRLGRQLAAENNRQEGFAQAPIRAELIGSDRCEAEGITACGYAPVLQLCRELVAAGFNPACPLEAWRGETLCLRIRGRLTVADDRHGTPRLRRRQDRPPGYVAGSPVAQIADGPARAAGHRGDRAMSKGGIAPRKPRPAFAQADDGAKLQSADRAASAAAEWCRGRAGSYVLTDGRRQAPTSPMRKDPGKC
jgi:hypothetical protein